MRRESLTGCLIQMHLLCVVVFSGRRDEEAFSHPEQSVQTFSGDVDEDAQRLPAVLRSLRKTKRVKKADGGNCYLFCLF